MEKTIEQKAYEVLTNEYYTLIIGGEELKFRYATLDDLQKISAMASALPNIKSDTNDAEQIFESFKYADQLVEIILLTVFIDVKIDKRTIKRSYLKSAEEIYREIYNKEYTARLEEIRQLISKVKIIESWATIQSILKNNHVFFYLDIIASLKGTNILKPTKEMSQTAPG